MAAVTIVLGPFARYQRTHDVLTKLDPVQALTTQLQFLTSQDYTAQLLHEVHHAPASGLAVRARRIGTHVRVALAYIDQAASGPSHVSFLPSYYAVLNLLKVYILLSPRHAELDANRWHGAQYEVLRKDSQLLPTEEITVHPKGTISLFYEVVSGKTFGRKRNLSLRGLYPYVSAVADEWHIASGTHQKLALLRFEIEKDPAGKRVKVTAVAPTGSPPPRKRDLHGLIGCAAAQGAPGVFRANQAVPDSTDDNTAVASCLDPLWLFTPVQGETVTPIYSGQLVMFEELPITLAFFHLSSIVRYKPEFLARVRDSRYWPVVATMPKDVMLTFLCLCWSHVQQQHIDVHGA